MVSQGAQEHQSQDCVDGLTNFSILSVSAQPAGAAAFAMQRSAANSSSSKPSGAKSTGGSSKNPFAAMPREMRNNQLRNNLAAVAEQFKAMSSSPTSAAGLSSPTAGSARNSAEFGTFQPQQPAPHNAANGCQVTVPQHQPIQTATNPQQTAITPAAANSRFSHSNSPCNGILPSSTAPNSCSPSMLHGFPANPATYPRPPPPNQHQQFLQQQYPSNRQPAHAAAGARSTSFELHLNRSGSDPAAALEGRHNSVDLSPYMVHQMQQLQQQPGTYGMQRGPQMTGAALPSLRPTSDPFPHLLMSSCNGASFSQQQQMLMMQPLLLGQSCGYSSSDPAMYTPSMQQQQPQMVMSASASLPPVTVALPVAQQHAAAHTERQLQKLLFNQQMEHVMQQRLLQLSAEY